MITLEDRLHDTGDDLRRAATQVPARGLTYSRPIRRAAGWLGAAAAIGVLIALPLWLSGGGTAPEGPPVGGGSASTSSEAQPPLAPFGLDEAHIILELAPGLSSEHAEGLVAQLRQHPEVDAALLVTRDEAVSEWLEIRAATFGGDEASLQAAMAEVRASIRLLVHEATDRRAFGESLAAGLLRREGQPEPRPVVTVIVNTSDSRDADMIGAPTTSTTPDVTTTGPEADPTAGAQVELVPIRVECTSELAAYPCSALIDGDPTTSWMAPNGGIGAELTFWFEPAVQISHLTAENLRDECQFMRNARIRGVEVEINDTPWLLIQHLEDTNATSQEIELDSMSTHTSRVVMKITSAHASSSCDGQEPFVELALQGVTFFGRVAPSD